MGKRGSCTGDAVEGSCRPYMFIRITKGSYTKEEGMQLNGNHVDGEILSDTKNKYAFTEVS